VNFNGTEDFIVYDDITLGSSTPGNPGTSSAPEPGSLAMLGVGLLGLGFVVSRKRRV
jgi:hypothetical protein